MRTAVLVWFTYDSEAAGVSACGEERSLRGDLTGDVARETEVDRLHHHTASPRLRELHVITDEYSYRLQCILLYKVLPVPSSSRTHFD